MKKYKVYAVFLLCLIFIGCKKEGAGGKAQIAGIAYYNGTIVPGAIIYIKYGTTTSPGPDPTSYDSQITADASGNFTFGSLEPGNYYLFAIGHYSTSLGYINISGGNAANIPHKKSSVNYDIALTK